MCVSGILSLCVLVLICSTDAIIDYCSSNKFNSNSTYMEFTKEVSIAEYIARYQFKGLHCCSKGYRSIEWYKDNKPYPWPNDVSSFILYPEAANQTIYTQTILFSDNGKYTCVLRNDTSTYSRDIMLNVIDKLPDAPKSTFVPIDQEIELGRSARLFCEAFVGKFDLPDASNEILWIHNFSDLSKNQQNGRIKVEEVSREDGQVLGAYLTISPVLKEDFGEYTCKISNPDTSIVMKLQLREKELYVHNHINPVPWLKIIFVVIVVMLLILKIFLLNLHFGLPLRVKFKDTFGRINQNDNKKYDMLICYSENDNELIRGTFIPTLEEKYNYICFGQELSNDVRNWYKALENNSKNCRCVVAVLSPACFDNKWDVNVLTSALEHLILLNTQIICVALKEMPNTKTDLKNTQGDALSRLSKSINIVQLPMNDKKFWYYLRLGLPPKRAIANNPTENETNVKRLNFDSQESLEILV